jgi:hypothetical protein
MTSQLESDVTDVTRCPLASRSGVLTLDLQVGKEKHRTKSSDIKLSVGAQSTNPKTSCPPS